MPDSTKSKKMILGNDDYFENPADRARYNALHPYVPDTSNTEDDDFKTPADRAKYNAQHPYVPNGNSTSSRILGNEMKSSFNASYKKPDPVTDIFNKVYGPVNPLSQPNPIATMSSPEYSNKVMKSMFDYTNSPKQPQPLPMMRILPPKDNTSAARWLAEEAMQHAYDQQASINAGMEANLKKNKSFNTAMELNENYKYLRNLKEQIDNLKSQEPVEQNNLNSFYVAPPKKKDWVPDWLPDWDLSKPVSAAELLGRPSEAMINVLRYTNYARPDTHPELFNKETIVPSKQQEIVNAMSGKTTPIQDWYTIKKNGLQAAISGLTGEEAPTTIEAIMGDQAGKEFQKQHPIESFATNAVAGAALDPLNILMPGVEELGKVGVNALRSESLATKAMEAAVQETRLSEEASRLATEMMKNPKMTTFDALAKASPELQQRMTTELLSGSKTALDKLTEQTKNILGDSFANRKLTAKDLLNAASQKQWNPVINKLELAKYLPKAKPFMPNWGSNAGKAAIQAATKPISASQAFYNVLKLRNTAKDIPEVFVYGSESNPLKLGEAGNDILSKYENLRGNRAVGRGSSNLFNAEVSDVNKGTSSAVEEMASLKPQKFAEDLSKVTGKGAQARNKAINSIIKEDFPALNLTYKPQYNPDIRTGIAQEGWGTQIGKDMFKSRNSLRDTIVHEEQHHRWWERGIYNHHPKGSELEAKFYEIIDRYFRLRGWDK